MGSSRPPSDKLNIVAWSRELIEGKEVIGTNGVVSAWPKTAARIGARILEDEGNAMDAAASACLACAVLAPDKNGIGGYVLAAVVLEGKTGRVWSLDANGVTPAMAREDLYRILPRRECPKRINENEYSCISSLQILQMHDALDPVPEGDVAYWHRWAEVLTLAWRDRFRYAVDPDFAEVPVERLLSRDCALGRGEALRQLPDRVNLESWGISSETVPETPHASTTDVDGNLATAAITQGSMLGSGVVVVGTGIFFEHGMCRFDPRPNHTNSVAPRKRPLNNVAPMVIRITDRDVATGLPGGRRLISMVAQIAQRLVDFGASPREAAEAQCLHVAVEKPIEVRSDSDPGLIRDLEKMGHHMQRVEQVWGMPHIAECVHHDGKITAGGEGWEAEAD